MKEHNEEKSQSTISATDNKSIFYKIAYWTAYPFWPKEMKELVRKYKSKGTLNNKPIIHLNIITASVLLIYCGFSLAALYKFGNVYLFSVLLLLSLLLTWLQARMIFRRLLAPYSFGSKTKVKVKKVVVYDHKCNSKKIYCVRVDTHKNEEIIIGRISEKIWKKEDLPQEGEAIDVYFDQDKKYGAMPDIDYMIENFSLFKRI